jgi:hypothetical protein
MLTCGNGDPVWYVIVAAIALVAGWLLAYRDTSAREQSLDAKSAESHHALAKRQAELDAEHSAIVAEVDSRRVDFEMQRAAWQQEYERLLAEVRDLRVSFDKGFLQGREWLAAAFSEYVRTRDADIECALVVKPNPAWKAAEVVASLRGQRTQMARELKLLQYQLASYEEYFPVLLDYRDAILDEVVDLRHDAAESLAGVDPALGLGYLTKSEYDGLASVERFQLALDRYWKRDKSSVEIGRLYERYIGYLYETDGWTVRYHGALRGFEDFGRDLICTRDGSTQIVQCKCWSKAKVVREKHIMQLFGTSVLYHLTEGEPMPEAVLVATTDLSNEAAMVANELGVLVRHQDLERYPMVKCNVNPGTGERIYHLPFDQQYDRVLVGDQPDEFYAETVEEAEAVGFRRAYRRSVGHSARHPRE